MSFFDKPRTTSIQLEIDLDQGRIGRVVVLGREVESPVAKWAIAAAFALLLVALAFVAVAAFYLFAIYVFPWLLLATIVIGGGLVSLHFVLRRLGRKGFYSEEPYGDGQLVDFWPSRKGFERR